MQAGMLTQSQLAEAVRHARGKRLQIGQILVMCGYVSARDLQNALEAQSVIRDKSVDMNLALRCLKVAYKIGTNFQDVLRDHEGGYTSGAPSVAPQPKLPTGKLGELLVDAGVINRDQLDRSMQRSLQTGLPLGRMLVLQQIIADALLNVALEVQVRLRDEMLTRDEAIKALQEAAGLPVSELESQQPTQPEAEPKRRSIRLGELMVLAGLLTETDVMNALEWGLVNDQPIGQVLITKGLISQELLDAALVLQKKVDERSLDAVQASECLSKVKLSDMTIDEAIADLSPEDAPAKPAINYHQLLTLARVVTHEDIEAAFDLSTQSGQIIGKVLVLTGYMDVPTLQATLRAHQLLSKGLLTRDDAVASLDYCLHQRSGQQINFDHALRELGWTSAQKQLRLPREISPPQLDSTQRSLEESIKRANQSAPTPEPASPAVAQSGLSSLLGSQFSTGSHGRLPSFTGPRAAAMTNSQSRLPAVPASTGPSTPPAGPQSVPAAGASPDNPAQLPAAASVTPPPGTWGVSGAIPAQPPISPADGAHNPLSSASAAFPDAASATPTIPTLQFSDGSPTSIVRQDVSAIGLSGPGAVARAGGSTTANADSIANAAAAHPGPASETPISAPAAAPAAPESIQPSEAPGPDGQAPTRDSTTSELDLLPQHQGVPDAAHAAQSLEESIPPPIDAGTDTIFDGIEEELPPPRPKVKHTDTILPEDAKAHQLAQLASMEAKNRATGRTDDEQAKVDTKDALLTSFARLAQSYSDQGNYAEAQQVYERVLVNRMNELGPNHPDLTGDLNNLATVLCVQGKFNQAEPFMRRSVTILETSSGVDPLKVADALSLLGRIYFRQEKLTDAEAPFQKAVMLRKQHLRADHPDIAEALTDYAKLLRRTSRNDEAENLYAQAQEILASAPTDPA